MLIDTHAHLMAEEFGEELPEVLKRLSAAGVAKVVNVGYGIKSSEWSLRMSAEYDFLYGSLGLHPYDAADYSEELFAEWGRLLDVEKKLVAVGECGLDYFKAEVDAEVQKSTFEKHIQLAILKGLPLIVHNRAADKDCLEMLKFYQREAAGLGAVFHCFGSDLEFAKRVWSAGFLTSFTGIITYPSAQALREVVAAAPLEQMMIETDCPYLAPQGRRGKRNEPEYLVEIFEKVVALRSEGREILEAALVENSLRFFSRMKL